MWLDQTALATVRCIVYARKIFNCPAYDHGDLFSDVCVRLLTRYAVDTAGPPNLHRAVKVACRASIGAHVDPLGAGLTGYSAEGALARAKARPPKPRDITADPDCATGNGEETAEDLVAEKWRTSAVISLLCGGLPTHQRQRLHAYFFRELSSGEISRAEGVSNHVVTQSIKKGLRNLRRLTEHLAD